MGGCMGQWVGSGQMTNLIKLELISRHPYLWVDGWVNGWAHDQINLDLIEIIQFGHFGHFIGHFT